MDPWLFVMSCYTNLIFSLFLFYRFLSEEPSPYRGGEVCVPHGTYELCCLVQTPSRGLPWQMTLWRGARIRMVREVPWRMMKRRWGLSSIWRHWVKFTPSVKVSWKLPMDWPFPKAHDKFRRTFLSLSLFKGQKTRSKRCEMWPMTEPRQQMCQLTGARQRMSHLREALSWCDLS